MIQTNVIVKPAHPATHNAFLSTKISWAMNREIEAIARSCRLSFLAIGPVGYRAKSSQLPLSWMLAVTEYSSFNSVMAGSKPFAKPSFSTTASTT